MANPNFLTSFTKTGVQRANFYDFRFNLKEGSKIAKLMNDSFGVDCNEAQTMISDYCVGVSTNYGMISFGETRGNEEVYKIAQDRSFNEITMTFYADADGQLLKFFQGWMDEMYSPETHVLGWYRDVTVDLYVGIYKKNGAIATSRIQSGFSDPTEDKAAIQLAPIVNCTVKTSRFADNNTIAFPMINTAKQICFVRVWKFADCQPNSVNIPQFSGMDGQTPLQFDVQFTIKSVVPEKVIIETVDLCHKTDVKKVESTPAAAPVVVPQPVTPPPVDPKILTYTGVVLYEADDNDMAPVKSNADYSFRFDPFLTKGQNLAKFNSTLDNWISGLHQGSTEWNTPKEIAKLRKDASDYLDQNWPKMEILKKQLQTSGQTLVEEKPKTYVITDIPQVDNNLDSEGNEKDNSTIAPDEGHPGLDSEGNEIESSDNVKPSEPENNGNDNTIESTPTPTPDPEPQPEPETKPETKPEPEPEPEPNIIAIRYDYIGDSPEEAIAGALRIVSEKFGIENPSRSRIIGVAKHPMFDKWTACYAGRIDTTNKKEV